MSELHGTLQQLTLAQHLLGLVFLLSYGTALGSMFGATGRLRALALALLAAAGFAALTRPWELGVLLVVCAIGAIGLFIAVAWGFSACATSARWASGRRAPSPNRSPSPELRDAATRAVARAAHQVKRRRHHRTT